MVGSSNSEEGSGNGTRFEPSSRFFRRKPVGGQCKQVQDSSRLVSETDCGGQDLLTLGQSRRRSDGFNFQPKSTFFLQLESRGPRGAGTGCSSGGRGLDGLGEPLLLSTFSSHRGSVEEGGRAESKENDLGGALVDVQDVSSIASGV